MTDDSWTVRLAAAIAVHKRRRRLREMARAEMAAARQHGLEARHQEKEQRMTRKRPAAEPCGCRPNHSFCPAHWSQLSPQQRRDHLAGLPAERVHKL